MRTFPPIVALFTVCLATVFAQSSDSLVAAKLSCEGLIDPGLIDYSAPRFSWQLESAGRGTRQTAYQLRIIELDPSGKPVANGTLETAQIKSDQSQWVNATGFSPKPKTRYQWQVRVLDEKSRDSGWSELATFETGLRGQPWPGNASWIGDGRTVARDAVTSARYFRSEFDLIAKPVKARLFVSAFGIVEPWLNGGKVGNDYFVPGWPDYRRRVFYVTYDVTSQMQVGRNALGLILADGWYSGSLLGGSQAGSQPIMSAFLELTDAAGQVTTIATGKDWKWAEGPITAQGIYYGETFDARRNDPLWCTPAGGASWTWKPAQVQGIRAMTIDARVSPPVRRTQELKPISRREIQPGVFLYDLGQNMVGWVRLKVQAPAGRELEIKFAEMLEAPDKMHTANLRGANATARYVARGEGVETWEPRFTFFGFRYVQVSGVDQLPDDAITGIVLHSDLPRIGKFECSNPALNQLYSNTVWGQRGNFLEVPTDCPQRDERLGWTGDAQVFAHTANYNFASDTFYRQWLAAMRDGYRDEPGGESGFPDVVPDIGFGHGSAGWGDAAVIIPYMTWLHTGDRRLLEENFDAIQRWVEAQARDFPDGIRRSNRSYGDWLAPGFDPGGAPTPYVLIATAYYGRVTDIAGRIAAELGRSEAAERDRALFAKIKEAFRREFFQDDGRITSDEQTAYLLALGFDLTPEALREKAIAHLLRKFAEKNDHLATGFLGTPLVVPMLSRLGHADLAYRVLLQESYPGWLFSVKNGATTIWERWDSWTPEKGFNTDGMNSFNHYAYGSVVGWFYDTIAGISPDSAGAGWKTFSIAPSPGGGLTEAKASLETPYGTLVSGWKISGGRISFDIVVPTNTTAKVSLPVTKASSVKEGGLALEKLREASGLSEKEGRVLFTLAPGSYRFEAAIAK